MYARAFQRVNVSMWFLLIIAIFAMSGLVLAQPAYATRAALFMFVVSGWLLSLCLHELGHAVSAYAAGDHSVERSGYLRLDPASYLDPMNSILFPLLILVLGGIGLPGAAVYVEKWRMTRKMQSIVSLSGPLANLGFLLLLAIPFIIGLDDGDGRPLLWSAIALLAFLQVTSIAFNLLPVPGFDGFGIIEPYLPPHIREAARPLAGIAAFAVLFLFMFPNPFTRAFFNGCFWVLDVFSIDPRYALNGLREFRFWR